MVINQVIFPKLYPIWRKSKHARVTNQDVALFGYFNTNAILYHAILVCCKYFIMEFIIWYYNLLFYDV